MGKISPSIQYLRFLHNPYKITDVSKAKVAGTRLDHTRIYRVMTDDSSGTAMTDISTTITHNNKFSSRTENVVRMFYVGAEEDLDRYLRWLNNVTLRDSKGTPRPLYVLEQLVEDFYEEYRPWDQKDFKIQILMPGQLDSVDLLVDPGKGSRKRIRVY